MSDSTTSSPAPASDAEDMDFEPPASFTDTYFFPAFAQLQSEYHLGQPIYEEGETWCLLAEIDAASTSAGNPFCLVCHDRNGDNLIIGFDLSKGLRFTPSQFKVGYTIAVVYAKRVNFVDGTKGVRVADLKTCHECMKAEKDRKRHNDDCNALKDPTMEALLRINTRDAMEDTPFEFPG
ncbi:hypothetical protein K4K58_008408 [Colletotrichum sp. SAR11_239]|nr:hypothetical protein K4K58_008408 [Colletotrichum sp. SAR11_239]